MSAAARPVDQQSYARDVWQTRQSLNAVPDGTLVSLTGLGIDAVQALKQEIAEIFPASNLPAFLLQGLVHIEDRVLPSEKVAADLEVLFRSSKQIGLYGTFLAAPALLLHGYQRLLALAGKDSASAFPDGPWQFYTEFGLREDAARHTVETVGFERAAPGVGALNAITCWVAAAMATLFAYDDLLDNEWTERIVPRILDDLLAERAATELAGQLPRKAEARERAIADHADLLRQRYGLQQLASSWARQRPYGGPAGTTLDAYARARKEQFRAYLDAALTALPSDLRATLKRRVEERTIAERAAYQRQLAICMTLQSGTYQDQRTPLPLHEAHIALVVGGRYYLLPVCIRDESGHLMLFPVHGATDTNGRALPLKPTDDGTLQDSYGHQVLIDHEGYVRIGKRLFGRLWPPPIATIKGIVAAILRHARVDQPENNDQLPVDLLLAQAPRAEQSALRALLDPERHNALARLRSAPIILNWDAHDDAQPLSTIRQTRRGCGDHAMTLIHTDHSMVFDLSHIFFDGAWGMTLAEIMTNAASALAPAVTEAAFTASAAPAPLALTSPPPFVVPARTAAATAPVAVAAESTAIDLLALNRLRKRLSNIRLHVTVNDLLLLGRCAHAAAYEPGIPAQRALAAITALPNGAAIAQQINQYLEEQQTINPALLIPMDASAVDPRMRLYPATFRNPVTTLLPRLAECTTLVHQLQHLPDPQLQAAFADARRVLYSDLQTLGATLRVLKQVTMRGESFTTAALRLLGHLPGAMQHLVDMIPQKIGILNEILKGREVFSNVGQVAPTSSLTRFASARDDGATKLLVWGVMTDASGQLVVSLRDFRPHVAALAAHGRTDLASILTQDYLDAYADWVNALVRRIQRVFAYQ